MPNLPIIYLDHAAATPVDQRVLDTMLPYFSEQFYNPSATYSAAQAVHKKLEAARAQVAHWLGSRPSEITFTAGGSEANNLAIHGVMRQYPDANIVVSSIEHDSVLASAEHYDRRLVGVLGDGRISLEDLKKQIDDRTVLVSVMYANNEVGTIQPIRDVARIITDVRKARQQTGNKLPLLLHTDACQAANYLDLHVSRLGVDMLTLNGGKIYGPKQSGALYIRGGLRLQPQVDGGGQEHGLRSGTENVAANIGFALALDIAQTMRHEETERLQTIQKHCFEVLEQQLPNAVVNGAVKLRLPNNIHVTLPGQDNERLIIQLDEAGILTAAGSACSASDEEPSHVLKAMGLSDDKARSSLRLTLGRSTTEAMIVEAVQKLTTFSK